MMINKKRLLNTFIELVKVDSPSGEEQAIAKDLVARLNALGLKAALDSYGNVVGRLEGEGEPFMLNAHMDTVEPGRNIRPIIKKSQIKSDGTTILGGDCKAGLSIILEALSVLKEEKLEHPPLEVVFTREEETSLTGARQLDYSLISAKRGLTFDGPGQVTNVIVAAPFYNNIDIVITGISAHAGVEPEKGLSAIKVASELITKLKVGRIDFETTANVGLIKGGSARNAVPESVEVKAEIRSRNLKKLLRHTKHFEDVISVTRKKNEGAIIQANIHREFDGFVFSKNHPIVKKLLSTYKELDLTPNLLKSGGGTDVNIFITHGLELVCVGVGVYEPHTKREYVKTPEMGQAAEFLINFLKNH